VPVLEVWLCGTISLYATVVLYFFPYAVYLSAQQQNNMIMERRPVCILLCGNQSFQFVRSAVNAFPKNEESARFWHDMRDEISTG
jgi:hypothetical protein